VGRRTQEIGIRMALGALPGEVRLLILRETLMLSGAGILLGLPVALAAARAIQGFLYGVSGADPLVLASGASFLLIVGMLAGYVPARRASRIHPVESLRHE